MKKKLFSAIMGAAALAFAGTAMAGNTHTINVQASSISELNLANATVSDLTVSSATAGAEADSAQSSLLSDELLWTTNQSSQDIMASYQSAPSATFTLSVTASSCSGGASGQSSVSLSTSDADIVTGIGQSYGDCDLQYTLSAPVANGSFAQEAVVVVYTINAAG